MGHLLSKLSRMHFETRESITMTKMKLALQELHTMYQEDILNFQDPLLAAQKIAIVQEINLAFSELKHLVRSGSLNPYLGEDYSDADEPRE
jgi:hypothetical protein